MSFWWIDPSDIKMFFFFSRNKFCPQLFMMNFLFFSFNFVSFCFIYFETWLLDEYILITYFWAVDCSVLRSCLQHKAYIVSQRRVLPCFLISLSICRAEGMLVTHWVILQVGWLSIWVPCQVHSELDMGTALPSKWQEIGIIFPLFLLISSLIIVFPAFNHIGKFMFSFIYWPVHDLPLPCRLRLTEAGSVLFILISS